MSLFKFTLIQLGIVFVLLAASWWPVTEWLKPGSLTFVYTAICLSAFSGLLAYFIISNGISIRIQLFTTFIIGSMLAKMMIGIASIFIIALKFKDFSTEYVLSYFMSYFIFTSFEVYALMRKLRPFSREDKRKSHEKNAHN